MSLETDSLNTLFLTGAAQADAKVHEPDLTEVAYVVVPPNYTVRLLTIDEQEKCLGAPLRKRGNLGFGNVDSFVRYFNEHKNPDSRIFAVINDDGARFEGRLNFHGKDPAWGDHKCFFALTPTHEYEVWSQQDCQQKSQCEFAAFLEANAEMFADPKGADLLELVQSLEGHSEASINSAIKLTSGSIKLAYTEEVTLKGNQVNEPGEIELPSILNVSIMPFQGTAIYPMKARMRYRISDRRITLWYERINPHEVVRAVANDVLKNIAANTGVDPFTSAA